MNKQKFIFLGGIFDDEKTLKQIQQNSKGNIQYAADNFQKALLRGFHYYINDNDFELVNLPFIGGFPFNYEKPLFSYVSNGKKNVINNLMFYKNISREKFAFKRLKDILQKNDKSNFTIFVYSMHSPFLNAVSRLKMSFPSRSIQIVLIIPDLPEYMNLGKARGAIFRKLKDIDTKNVYKQLRYIDFFVTLTNEMAKKIKAKKYVVVEGINNCDKLSKNYENNSKSNNILYTGTIDAKYGVLNLANAFLHLDTEFKLIIYGAGDSREELSRISEESSSIEYRGLVSHERIVEEQRKAKFLINPRNQNEEYTKYSFPSKIMEYMVSGTPVITSKLLGIPEEYFPYLLTIDASNEEQLSSTLKNILDQDYSILQRVGDSAREFVIQNKNFKVQVKKILGMINYDFN